MFEVAISDGEAGDVHSMLLKIDEMWTCTKCLYGRKQKSHVKEHIESVHLKVTVVCPECGKECLKSGYRVHKRIHSQQAAIAAANTAAITMVGHAITDVEYKSLEVEVDPLDHEMYDE